jgi:hypothetical protein
VGIQRPVMRPGTIQTARAIIACSSFLSATQAFATQIWLTPNTPNGNEHYTQLLQSSEGWPTAVKGVKVFKISDQFAIFATDQEFSAFIDGTKRLNLQIAMERAAQRIKKYGATLSYIAMDSVLIFGHELTGPNACRDSIESLATQVAQKVKQARSVFPDIQVGDIEPIGNPRPGWLQDIAAWTKAYQAATGTPLAFFQFDVDWNNPNWPQQLKAGADTIQSLGIPIAVTYNGSKAENSGRAWVAKAVEHFRPG